MAVVVVVTAIRRSWNVVRCRKKKVKLMITVNGDSITKWRQYQCIIIFRCHRPSSPLAPSNRCSQCSLVHRRTHKLSAVQKEEKKKSIYNLKKICILKFFCFSSLLCFLLSASSFLCPKNTRKKKHESTVKKKMNTLYQI